MAYTIRSAQAEDLPFLWEMLYQAIYVPKEVERPGHEILEDPKIAKYLANWGQDHDYALIAVDDHDAPLGAIWIRRWDAANHGWGYVDAVTPELVMAIRPEYRGQGIGSQLLDVIADYARRSGYAALSLSVDPRNEVAAQLYQRRGYQRVDRGDGGSWTMKKNLS